MTPERPRRAEAIRTVRARYKIPDTVPDREVAESGAVAWEELELAWRAFCAAVFAQFQRRPPG